MITRADGNPSKLPGEIESSAPVTTGGEINHKLGRSSRAVGRGTFENNWAPILQRVADQSLTGRDSNQFISEIVLVPE